METAGVPQGDAICISKLEGTSMIFDLENLRHILCKPDIINTRVSVVTVSGDSSSANSFMLNSMLKYLTKKGVENWFDEENETLDEFDWCGGLPDVSRGVWAWNTLLPHRIIENKEVNVMVVDTECLHTLIRDWDDSAKYPFGSEGGDAYQKDMVPVPMENSSFYKTHSTYILPRIDGGSGEDDSSEMLDQFISHYANFISSIFSEVNLSQKIVFDRGLTCGDLFNYCKQINQLITERGGVRGVSTLEAESVFYSSQKRMEHTEHYRLAMEKRSAQDPINLDDLDGFHLELKKEVMWNMRKMIISEKMITNQCERLGHEINHMYLFVREHVEHMIKKRLISKDCELSLEVMQDFQQNIIRDIFPGRSHTQALTQMKQARDVAIERLKVGLTSSGTFCEALLQIVEANIAALGNEVYDRNHVGDDFYEEWRDRNDQKIQEVGSIIGGSESGLITISRNGLSYVFPSNITLSDCVTQAAEVFRQREQTNYETEPAEFCDALTCALMDDPVMLPQSRTVVERSTILRHMLDNKTDPFNRMPLTVEELIPLPELKSRIQVWNFDREMDRRRTLTLDSSS